jgi:hypothetical protein
VLARAADRDVLGHEDGSVGCAGVGGGGVVPGNGRCGRRPFSLIPRPWMRSKRQCTRATFCLHDGGAQGVSRSGEGAVVGAGDVTGILEVDVQDEGLVFNREACRVHSLE